MSFVGFVQKYYSCNNYAYSTLKPHFDLGLELAKKHGSNLSVIECVYKIQPKFYFFETESDKKTAQDQVANLKEELKKWKELAKK